MRLMTLLLFLNVSFAADKYINCSNTPVRNYHNKAVLLLKNASRLIKVSPYSKSVRHNLKKYFKLDVLEPNDLRLVNRVFNNVHTVSRDASKSVYKCKPQSNYFWCMTEPLAIVPPPKTRIYLCPKFFKLSDKKKVGVTIHEMFHMWGGFNINYLPETYCYDRQSLSRESLVRQADQYMLFVMSLDAKSKLECF